MLSESSVRTGHLVVHKPLKPRDGSSCSRYVLFVPGALLTAIGTAFPKNIDQKYGYYSCTGRMCGPEIERSERLQLTDISVS